MVHCIIIDNPVQNAVTGTEQKADSNRCPMLSAKCTKWCRMITAWNLQFSFSLIFYSSAVHLLLSTRVVKDH